jgi:hypothetical protein
LSAAENTRVPKWQNKTCFTVFDYGGVTMRLNDTFFERPVFNRGEEKIVIKLVLYERILKY